MLHYMNPLLNLAQNALNVARQQLFERMLNRRLVSSSFRMWFAEFDNFQHEQTFRGKLWRRRSSEKWSRLTKVSQCQWQKRILLCTQFNRANEGSRSLGRQIECCYISTNMQHDWNFPRHSSLLINRNWFIKGGKKHHVQHSRNWNTA